MAPDLFGDLERRLNARIAALERRIPPLSKSPPPAGFPVQAEDIADYAVTNDKLAKEAAGEILIGQGAGTDMDAKAVSGDATLAATGALTIANDAITNVKVAAAAAIALTKIAGNPVAGLSSGVKVAGGHATGTSAATTAAVAVATGLASIVSIACINVTEDRHVQYSSVSGGTFNGIWHITATNALSDGAAYDFYWFAIGT